MRHRAPGIGRCDLLECLPCLWIRHVMQEGDRPIELHLGLFGAGNGKVNRAQGMAGVLVDLASHFAHATPKQDEHHTEVQDDTTKCALH